MSHFILILLALIPRADCQPFAQPKQLPALDAVLDSTGLLSRIQAADSTPAEVLVSVFLGTPPDGRVLEGSAPTTSAQLALREVLAALRPGSSNAPPGFRVRVRFGAAPSLGLERSVLCTPESEDDASAGQVPFTVGRVEARPSSAPTGRTRSITPSYRINSFGRVIGVELGGGTGVPQLDRAIHDAALERRYRPATLDGRAVEVWLTGTKVEVIR